MILVADSGSTKTAWILTDGKQSRCFATQGLNPYHIKPDIIGEILAKELLPETGTAVSTVYFYGAGCTPAKIPEMAGIFAGLFPASRIEVESDLLGACRGLCGDKPGVVCILGTGSNSCEYDGEQITDNIPALGYILGDEGSGAALGKAFVTDLLRGYIPEDMSREFFKAHNLTPDDIIENIYRKPGANRFLAGFAPFIAKHRNHPDVRDMITRAFRWFIGHRVNPYGAEARDISFTGSIAVHFSDLLTEVVEDMGHTMRAIVQSPIGGLARYHAER